MALKDILERIDDETEAEAERIVSAAREEAENVRQAARSLAAELSREQLERAEIQATQEAAALVASARLRARDNVITEKRAFIAKVLDEAVARIEALPDAEYAEFLWRHAAPYMRVGASVRIGFHDEKRLAESLRLTMRDVVADEIDIGVTDEIGKGLLIYTERIHVEVSADSIIRENRSRLEVIAAKHLFRDD